MAVDKVQLRFYSVDKKDSRAFISKVSALRLKLEKS